MPVFSSYAGELASKLDSYRSLGQKEARNYRPVSEATRPDENESSLRSLAEKHLSHEQHLLSVVLGESSRASVEIKQKLNEYEANADRLTSETSMLGAIESDLAGERSDLVSKTQARIRCEVDWRGFRAANNITDEATYPESHIWHFGVIAALALLETVINAFFYENTQGLLGGFMVALSVAAMNMVGALLLGMGFRYKNLIAIDKKLLGWLCLVLFVVLALYCNAIFASFRSTYQLVANPDDAVELRQAFAAAAAEAKLVFTASMSFGDLMSFILFGIGLILSGIAFWKGYTFDDRYPGHGTRDRAVKAARAKEVEKQELVRQKVKDYLHTCRSQVQDCVNEPMRLLNRAAARVTDLQHAKSTLLVQTKAIQRDFALVLQGYRSANTAVRASDPPNYFQFIEDLTSRIDASEVDQLVGELQELQEEAKLSREKNSNRLNLRLNELLSESSRILGEVFSNFIKGVEADATSGIERLVPTIHRSNKDGADA